MLVEKRLHRRRCVFCERLSSRAARPPAAPRSRSSAIPRASRRGQTDACFLVRVRGSETRFVLCNVPPSHCVRPDPRDSRRAPQRVAVLKRFLGFYGSRSWRWWSWAARSELERASGRRLAPYLRAQRAQWGAATKRSEERGAERSEGGALHNTNAFLCNVLRCTTQTPSYAPAIGARCTTQTVRQTNLFYQGVLFDRVGLL